MLTSQERREPVSEVIGPARWAGAPIARCVGSRSTGAITTRVRPTYSAHAPREGAQESAGRGMRAG